MHIFVISLRLLAFNKAILLINLQILFQNGQSSIEETLP